MPSFGKRSSQRLSECHPDLQRLFREVVKNYDCTIICGHRSPEEQNLLLIEGKTKVEYGKHNLNPSEAVDAAPWFKDKPNVRWEDREAFYHFVGYVRGVADQIGVKIRVGADWDSDMNLHDQTFNDLPHFELVR